MILGLKPRSPTGSTLLDSNFLICFINLRPRSTDQVDVDWREKFEPLGGQFKLVLFIFIKFEINAHDFVL